MFTVGLYTLGCKVSQYETEAIAEKFAEQGFVTVDFSVPADIYVINTCTVTAESDRKCRQVIRRALRQNPKAKTIVLGCYSQRSPEEVEKIEGVSAIIGSADKLSAVDIAKRLLDGGEPFGEGGIAKVTDIDEEPFEKMRITGGPRTRVYVKIEDGCECRCSYCAIPSARGKVRSKPREEVLSEVFALADKGVCEIVLTGIETGSYGVDFDMPYTLADLLCDIEREGKVKRIRLGSLAPELIGEKFSSKIKNLKSLAPHFHISIQSGSDKILAAMRRRYKSETALENIRRLKTFIPGARFTTDLMVGFPGESEEDFLSTLDFVRKARFIDCHVFAYSRRKDTPAASMPCQVAEETKKERSERLIAVCREVRDEVLSEIVERGEPLSVVFESEKGGCAFGHSAEFAEVSICLSENGVSFASVHGRIEKCIPVSHKDGVILAKLID